MRHKQLCPLSPIKHSICKYTYLIKNGSFGTPKEWKWSYSYYLSSPIQFYFLYFVINFYNEFIIYLQHFSYFAPVKIKRLFSRTYFHELTYATLLECYLDKNLTSWDFYFNALKPIMAWIIARCEYRNEHTQKRVYSGFLSTLFINVLLLFILKNKLICAFFLWCTTHLLALI